MKNLLVSSSLILWSVQAFAGSRHGNVLCDIAQPRPVGFALIELRDGPRSYKGSYDLNGLRFKGSYSPSDKQFTLAIVRYDQELLEEVGATILESTQNLDSMNYLKLAFTVPAEAQEAATRLEFYCRVHWDMPIDQVIAP